MKRLNHGAAAGMLVSCVVGFVFTAQAQTCVEPASGLVAWWPGDGDSIDLETGLHGVAMNGAGYGTGLVGDAFSFDGVTGDRDQRVDLPPAALDGLSDMTVEMWVRSEAEVGTLLSGASNLEAFTDNEIALYQSPNGAVGFIRQKNTGVLPDVFVNDGSWHHVAFTRSGALGTLYLDGVVVDARGFPTEPLELGPGGLMLGQEQDCLAGCLDPAQAFDGMIDEVAFYDRALSEEEITAIFEAREAGKCKPTSNEEVLQQEIAGLESEIGSLTDRIAELEAAAEAEPECVSRHDRRYRSFRRWIRQARHKHRRNHH